MLIYQPLTLTILSLQWFDYAHHRWFKRKYNLVVALSTQIMQESDVVQTLIGSLTLGEEQRMESFPDRPSAEFPGLTNFMALKLYEITTIEGVSVSYDAEAKEITLEFDSKVDPFDAADAVARLTLAPEKVWYGDPEHKPGGRFILSFTLW